MQSLKVLDFLKKREPAKLKAPVFCFLGQDGYLLDLVHRKLEAFYIEPEFRDFNLRRFSCKRATSAGEISSLLSELPMLVEHRLLFVDNIDCLAKEQSSRLAETWTKDIAAGTVVAVTMAGGIKDSPWAMELSRVGVAIDCRLDDAGINSLLTSFLRKREVRVHEGVLSLLRERVGSDLRSLISSLERCLLSLQPGETLERAKVEYLVPFSAEVALWKLTAAIGRRDRGEALKILEYQLERGETAAAILGYIYSYLSSLIEISGLYQELGSATAVAAAIPRKKPFQIDKSLKELKTWSEVDLRTAVEGVLRADFKSKGGEGGASPRLLLQMLVLKLCSRKP